MRSLLFATLLTLTPALAAPLAAQGTATYRVTFDATWSATTHPGGFPPNPHFSGLVGATHDASASLWVPGTLASEGIEVMAETGAKGPLLAEIGALRTEGRAGAVLSSGGVGLSPGAVALTFEASEAHPLVSLVTMLAPSPDWFVGVHGLDLREGDGWTGEVAVPLFVYDAGTDSGPSYTSPDQDTDPAAPVAVIGDAPFSAGGEPIPVGTFTFELLTSTSAEDGVDAGTFALSHPAPNPAAERSRVTLRVGTAQRVRVEVFDLLGRRALVLHDGPLAAGQRAFEVATDALAPGAYVVRARGAEGTATRRLTVTR